MGRTSIVGTVLIALSVASTLAQAARTPVVQLREAEYREQLEGDLRSALQEYEKAVSSCDRTLAMQALLAEAIIQQRLGDDEADAMYGRLLRDVAGHRVTVRFARKTGSAAPLPQSSATPLPSVPGGTVRFAFRSRD